VRKGLDLSFYCGGNCGVMRVVEVAIRDNAFRTPLHSTHFGRAPRCFAYKASQPTTIYLSINPGTTRLQLHVPQTCLPKMTTSSSA